MDQNRLTERPQPAASDSLNIDFSSPFRAQIGSAWQQSPTKALNEDDYLSQDRTRLAPSHEQTESMDELSLPGRPQSPQQRTMEGLPAHIRYASMRASQKNPLESYNAEKEIFQNALKAFPEHFQIKMAQMLEAFRFIDYADVAWEIMRAFRSFGTIDLLDAKLHQKYNLSGMQDGPSFENFQRCNAFLKKTELPPCPERLLQVQSIAMQGRVDDLHESYLGKYRDQAVVGIEDQKGISPIELRRIQNNPYLDFQISKKLKRGGSERIRGAIIYPAAETVQAKTLDRIRALEPELVQEIQSFQSSIKNISGCTDTQYGGQLTRRLIEALVKERYDFFNRRTTQIGELNTTQKVVEYVKAVALHYRDIISIHPLVDGNGRSCRLECLYAPLDRVGISRPRLNNPDADILYSPSDWIKEVWRGILSTSRIYLEVAERLQQGLRIENSPELLTPNISRDVAVHAKSKQSIKQQGSDKRIRQWKPAQTNARLLAVDGAQFAAYIDLRFSLDEDALYKRQFRKDPIATMQQLRDDYKEFFKTSQALITEKGVKQNFALKLVDFDFMWTFGDQSAAEKTRWDYKMSRWYSSDIDYRGLANFNGEGALSEVDVLDIFRVMTPHTVSQRLLSQPDSIADHQACITEIYEEFERYNRALLSGAQLVTDIRDHVFAEGGYDQSYGQSRTMRWQTARAFAMGGLSLESDPGDIQMKSYWKKQDLLDDRIVVGSYRAHKDINVNRLRIFADGFRARSNKQQEITAIGGVDPDAVMIVQRISARGKISETWLRNPAEPDRILHIDGSFMPDVENINQIDPARIRKIHRLQLDYWS